MKQQDVAINPNGLPVYSVTGRVSSTQRGGPGGLRVEIVDVSIGRVTPLAEVTTDDSGAYSASIPPEVVRKTGKLNPDLQAVAYQGDIRLGASDVHYNAGSQEVLNILLPDSAVATLRSEHEMLTGDIARHYDGRPASLQENAERKDITYLANKSGWDARAVALAALADQFSARTASDTGGPRVPPKRPPSRGKGLKANAMAAAPAIESPFFYALFRAGLPANEAALYQTDPGLVEQVWKQSIEQGIIPASAADSLPRAVENFRALSAQRALTGPALAGVSNMGELLNLTLKDNPQAQQSFAAIYTEYRSQPAKMWDVVSSQLGPEVAARLKVDGQLAFLTINNASLIQSLHQTIRDPQQLASDGYYHENKWQDLLANATEIPPEIPGDTVDVKRANYAKLMAAQVRLSYPTLALADQVRNRETPLNDGLHEPVATFLEENNGKFEIGMIPVQQYISRNNLQVAPEVVDQLKSIQRVYQITPNDQAMNGLLSCGLTSAYAVLRYEQNDFVQAFSEPLGGAEYALQTYTKAQQVYNYALNIATSYLTSRYAPQIGSDSTGPVIHSSSDQMHMAAIENSPDLESLFGSLDFCSCEECRSILSPAAYLVDLLEFIDNPVNLKQNPQDVLFARRPDIPNLPLTCENTTTPLPYIDVVNEILEYFVTHNLKLDNYTGHNTDGSATTEELLASPQFVSDAAYTLLAGELFPAPLPFHQPLENLRRYFDQFETPLPRVMTALRKSDAVERTAPTEYGWQDILMETLRISREEYALLTTHAQTLNQLYGFPSSMSDADVLAALTNVKAYTRRISISYQDIIDVLRARFVNPSSTLIPRLEALTVPFTVLKDLKDGMLSDNDFLALLPTGLDTTPYNGDVVAWVKDDTNYANIMSLITISGPSDGTCSFDQYEFHYANPDKQADQLRPFEFVRFLRFIRL